MFVLQQMNESAIPLVMDKTGSVSMLEDVSSKEKLIDIQTDGDGMRQQPQNQQQQQVEDEEAIVYEQKPVNTQEDLPEHLDYNEVNDVNDIQANNELLIAIVNDKQTNDS